MSNTYDSQPAASSYDSARGLLSETLELWMSFLSRAVPPQGVRRVLDLGGGTGRFAIPIRDTYCCPVIVVDPSASMMKSGAAFGEEDVLMIRGTGEHIPVISNSIDLVWASQSYHHFDNKPKACGEIARVLAPGGRLVIRNGTQESDAELEWTHCFPEAEELGKAKIPRQQDVLDLVCASGFEALEVTRVYQKFAISWQEHYDKVSRRGLSGLIEISDDAFEAGLRRFQEWVSTKPKDQPVFEPVDMFVFRKT